MSTKRTLWDLVMWPLCVGLPALVVLVVLGVVYPGAGGTAAASTAAATAQQNSLHIGVLALDANVRGTLFSALIAVAGMFLAVMLGVLALLTSLQDRPIVVQMKADRMYRRLILALLGPALTALLLLIASILCIVLPPSQSATWLGLGAASSAVALTLAGFAQSSWIAWLLARVLLWEEHETSGPEVSPRAARHHLKGGEVEDEADDHPVRGASTHWSGAPAA
jgi:hypothetical protein